MILLTATYIIVLFIGFLLGRWTKKKECLREIEKQLFSAIEEERNDLIKIHATTQSQDNL